jgi:hypothetical protein
MQKWLQGKKTYLIALGAIVTAVTMFTQGDATMGQAIAAIFAAITSMSMRAGIEKNGPDADAK